MATTIGDTISRVRNVIKAVKEDAFLTDRFIYSLVLKYGKLYIKRLDDQNKIMRFQSLFEVLPCVELIEIDKVDACCSGITSGCIIKRTKDRLPTVMEGNYGPLFRTISSMDGSIPCFKTYPATFTQMTNSTNFHYNKNKYYWYQDGYLYLPNIEWDAIRVEGLWEDSIAMYSCDECKTCNLRQDELSHFPEYLFAEIEKNVKDDLLNTIQIPKEGLLDNTSNLRD